MKKERRLGVQAARIASGAFLIICVVFVYIILINLLPSVVSDSEFKAVDGVLDLRGLGLDEPIEIIGQWTRFQNISCEDLPEDFGLLLGGEIVEIPMPFTDVTYYPSAYRLYIIPDAHLTEAYVFFSPIHVRYKVLLNGELIFGTGLEATDASLVPMIPVSTFRLDFDTSLPQQELIILICDAYEGADFFHSEFILGNSASIRLHVVSRTTLWALVTGLFIMLLINRLVFMTLCPENEIASAMTLIDVAIMFRILWGLPELYLVKFLLLDISLSNTDIARINFLPVLFIGVVTIHFVARIFNTENQVDKKWFRGITAMFGVVGIVFYFNIHLIATTFGFGIFMLFFVPGCFLGANVFIRYLREHRLNNLQVLYVCSLALIGFMIWFEMINMRSANSNFLILLSGYMALVLLHLCASLWENYSKYKEYEKLSEEQLRLDKLLQTVNSAAALLLAVENDEDYEQALMESLKMIGRTMDADRVQLWRTDQYIDGIRVSLTNHWHSELGEKSSQISLQQDIPYGLLPKWEELFQSGECFNGPVATLPREEQEFLNPNNLLKSTVIIPISIQDQFWGFFTIDDCVNERTLSSDEMDIMRSASLMIASTGHRIEQAAIMQHMEIVEESNRAKSRFLARMSHEIRTPITAVMGISEVQLQKSDLLPNIEESFAKIYNSANLLLGIINDILDLSKIEAGKMEILQEKYEVAGMISEVAGLYLSNLDNENIKFHLHVDENLPASLIGDTLRIEQITNNLLSNAFKYTKSGSVELSLKCENCENCENSGGDDVILVITVHDTGIGMSQEQISKLYDEYTRFHEHDNRYITGTGLGMPIVSSLTKLMGATIKLESRLGEGTTVTIRIPQKKAGPGLLGKETALSLQQFDARAIARTSKFTPEPMPYGNVLIVDDVDANLYVAEGLLAIYDIKTETCSSGYEALEKVKEGKLYDIVFMDQMMPGMDGTETMKHMRDAGYTGPIVVLTANAMMGQAEEFIKNGFDGFISKPIQMNLLNTVLLKHIRDKQPRDVIEAAKYAKNALSINIDDYQNDPQLMAKLHSDFAVSQRDTFANISRAMNSGDTKTAHLLAHSLKGVAGLIRENNLMQAAETVELLLAKGKIPGEDVLAVLEKELLSVLEKLGEPKAVTLAGPKDYDKGKVGELFDRLNDLLEDQNAECLDLLEELRDIPETAVLIKQIEDFDFSIALSTLGTLKVVLRV